MLVHRYGYKPGKENVASHCRRRYRLTGSSTGMSFDPSLWLVHYAPSEPTFRLPVNRIHIPPHVQQLLARRQFLQGQGRLVRKEFMLHDRTHWPTINPPAHASPSPFAHNIAVPPNAVQASPGHRAQQASIYAQHAAAQGNAGPSPAKRSRPMPYGQASAAAAAAAGQMTDAEAMTMEMYDEEDTALGDEFDYLTPRDVAMARFKHNQEMIGEVLASPFSLLQVQAMDLGLEPLLRTACNLPPPDVQLQSAGASTAAAAAAADTKRTTIERIRQRVLENESEARRLEIQHEKDSREFVEHCEFWKQAELRLREAEWDADEADSERGRVEGVDDAVSKAEAESGKRIYITDEVLLVQAGGLDENHPGLAQFRSRYHVGKRDWKQASAAVRQGTSSIGLAAAGVRDKSNAGGPSGGGMSTPAGNNTAAQGTVSSGQSQAAAAASTGLPLDLPLTTSPILDGLGTVHDDDDDDNMADAEARDWVMVGADEGVMPGDGDPQKGVSPAAVSAPTGESGQAASATTAAGGPSMLGQSISPAGGLGQGPSSTERTTTTATTTTTSAGGSGLVATSAVDTDVTMTLENEEPLMLGDSAFGDALQGTDMDMHREGSDHAEG